MSPQPKTDEFYINYATVPPSYRRFLIKFIASLVVGLLLFTVVLPRVHAQFNTGKLYGKQELEGLLVADPVPHLMVPRSGNTEEDNSFSRYALLGTGKTGAKPAVLEHLGEWVKLNGVVVSRNQLSVIAALSAEKIEQPPTLPATSKEGTPLGKFSLVGEILDGKCYPGVMKPGQGKTHRACAIRCIVGGVPAVFRVQNSTHDVMYLLLADQNGKAVNDQIQDLIADSIQITGEVIQYDDMYVIQADPNSYERV